MIKIIGENKDKDCKFSFAGKYDQLETLNGLKPYYNYYCIVAESADETNFKNLFQACQASIIYFHNFGTSKVTNMKGMFADCNSLVSLNVSSFDTSKVTDMTWMFFLCISLVSLDLSNFNTSNAIDMTEMFYACHSLISLDISSFNTQKVKNMDAMFFECNSLTSLKLSSFNTNNAQSMSGMFMSCNALKSLDISSFNFSAATNVNYMFRECSSLTNLKFGKNLKKSIDLSDCPLSHKSARSVINGLAEVKDRQSIQFSEKTYKVLTADDIQLIENKNWLIFNIKEKPLYAMNIEYNAFKNILPALFGNEHQNKILLNKDTCTKLTANDIKLMKKHGFVKINNNSI